MTETIARTKRNIIVPVLVAALAVAVGVQAWFMASMKRQLDTMHTLPQAANTISSTQSNSPSVFSRVFSNIGNQTSSTQHSTPVFNSNPFAQFGMNSWNPAKQFQQMQNEMNRMMSQAFNGFNTTGNGFNNFFSTNTLAAPDIKVKDEGNHYLVMANLPGADKNNISITLKNDVLTISGQEKQTQSKTGKNGATIFQSQQSSSFSRSVTLPGNIKPGSMHSSFDNNTLKITIAKKSS